MNERIFLAGVGCLRFEVSLVHAVSHGKTLVAVVVEQIFSGTSAVFKKHRRQVKSVLASISSAPELLRSESGKSAGHATDYACCGEFFLRDVVFLAAFVLLVPFFPAALIAPRRWTAA